MSSLEAIIHRASTDASFRTLLLTDSAAALSGYSLTEEEKSALLSVKSSFKDGKRRLGNAPLEWM